MLTFGVSAVPECGNDKFRGAVSERDIVAGSRDPHGQRNKGQPGMSRKVYMLLDVIDGKCDQV